MANETGGFGRKLADQLRFLKSWVQSPLKTGAVAPSGPHLVRGMAAAADPAVDGPLIELGPGTGVVTEALIARGFDEARIVAIEYNDDFSVLLRERFPRATILTGDAYAVADVVGGHLAAPPCAVVSSLPLFTQPEAARLSMVEACFDLLPPGRPFIQFSYALVSPVPRRIEGMTVETSPWIWRNVPPARVWVYRRPAR